MPNLLSLIQEMHITYGRRAAETVRDPLTGWRTWAAFVPRSGGWSLAGALKVCCDHLWHGADFTRRERAI